MKQYLGLLQDILDNGRGTPDRTGVGTRSVFGRQLHFDLTKGFPLMTTKKVPLRWVFEELNWMLQGHTNNDLLKEKGVNIWDEWATEEQTAKFDRKKGGHGTYLWASVAEFRSCNNAGRNLRQKRYRSNKVGS